MARPKPTDEELSERQERSDDWKRFRKDNLFTQKKLSDVTGISRRTIQDIEAARITPHATTLRVFNAFRKQYRANKKLYGRI